MHWFSVVEQSVEDNTDRVHIAVRPTLVREEVFWREIVKFRLNKLRFVRVSIRKGEIRLLAARASVGYATLKT